MQEYKLIDKFDGYKLLDRNGQVIYVQTDDVKKQLSLGNVRIYGLKLSESGRLLKETPEEIKEQQRRQQEQIRQQQLLEQQRQEQLRAEQQRQLEEQRRQEEEQARQLKANLQWKGTLFGVPLDEFKAEFGDRSYGALYDLQLRSVFDIKYTISYEDDMIQTDCIIHNYENYKSGIIQVYNSSQLKYVETEYYIALANKLWSINLNRPANKRRDRQAIVEQVEQMGAQKGLKFRLRSK